jgi:hypothetical protein
MRVLVLCPMRVEGLGAVRQVAAPTPLVASACKSSRVHVGRAVRSSAFNVKIRHLEGGGYCVGHTVNMTRGTPKPGMPAGLGSRRMGAVLGMLTMIPFVVLMPLGVALHVREGDGSGTLLGLAAGVLAVVVTWVVASRVYNRKLGRLAALAGPGGWGVPCGDPENPQLWRAILVDDDGVRMVRSSGVVCRDWRWENIRDVTVERFPVALVTHVGVVLHLKDGSIAELLLPSRSLLAYPLARAEAAAKDIRARLRAFRAGSSSFEVPSQ